MGQAPEIFGVIDSDRYQLRELLGRGGMGVVYRAYDELRQTEVALKQLTGAAPQALSRFKNEFRSLAQVSHPNLLQLYELERSGSSWFFTMELVRGVDFLAFVRGDSRSDESTMSAAGSTDVDDPTQSTMILVSTDQGQVAEPDLEEEKRRSSPLTDQAALARLRMAMRQVVDGVQALHDAGHLHRDLKPSNVLIESDGRAVVLDFGVVATLASGAAGERAIVGTPAYMAPEQAAAGELSEAADWYAIGVMLFEALTGRRPFIGGAREILATKQRIDPIQVRKLAPGAPADLAELADALLARDPGARPTGQRLLRALGGSSARVVAPTSRRPDRDVQLIGRAHHLAALELAYEEARAGTGRTIFVRGDSGVGKTALVDRFLAELDDDDDCLVLSGRCYEQESVPYKAVDSLIDALVAHLTGLPDRERAAVLPPGTIALARLFPTLEPLLRGDSGPAPVDVHQLKRLAVQSLRTIVERLARRSPVIMFIDDAQWGDADSAALLAQIFAGPQPPPILLLLAMRREDAEASSFLRTLARWHGPDRTIDLGPLPPDSARELALALLDPMPNRIRRADEIAHESGGNPFFTTQLSLFANDRARGAVPDTGEGVGLRAMLAGQLASLPDEARALLAVIAVSGQPIRRLAAVRAAELASGDSAAIALLRNSRLIRTRRVRTRELLEPYHDSVRAAVIDNLTPPRLRATHATLARALQRDNADAEQLMLHLEGAGELARAGHFAARAAENATRTLAFDRAATLYRRALELSEPKGEERAALLARLATALSRAGRSSEAGDLFRDAARLATGDLALDLRSAAADRYLRVGRIQDGVELFRQVLAELGLTLPRGRFTALLRIVYQAIRTRLRGLRYRPRPVSAISPSELRRLDVYWTTVVGFAMVNGLYVTEYVSRAVRLALDVGERERIARFLTSESLCLQLADTGRGRQRALRRATGIIAEELGEPYTNALAISIDVIDSYQRADFITARSLAAQALDIFDNRCTAVEWEQTTFGLFHAWSDYYLGDLQPFAARCDEAQRLAAERGDRYAVTAFANGLTCARWLMRDDYRGAREILDRDVASWPDSYGFSVQHAWELIGRLLVAIYEGETVAVWKMVRERWRDIERAMLSRIPMIYVEGYYLRGCAALLAAPEEPGAMRDVARCRRKLRKSRVQLAPALADVLVAGEKLHRGDGDSANRLLLSATAELDRIGCEGFATAARRARGALIGGDEGSELVARSDADLRARGVRAPASFARSMVPLRSG